ncbi:MAG: hypothetical protein JST06_05400 [Bacteroidetes bacterium]|nr:hypothetical protein [Bacteroidota bacterium]
MLQQAVGQGTFAMVDVGNDAEIPDMLHKRGREFTMCLAAVQALLLLLFKALVLFKDILETYFILSVAPGYFAVIHSYFL